MPLSLEMWIETRLGSRTGQVEIKQSIKMIQSTFFTDYAQIERIVFLATCFEHMAAADQPNDPSYPQDTLPSNGPRTAQSSNSPPTP
jgi:hypothetical protein